MSRPPSMRILLTLSIVLCSTLIYPVTGICSSTSIVGKPKYLESDRVTGASMSAQSKGDTRLVWIGASRDTVIKAWGFDDGALYAGIDLFDLGLDSLFDIADLSYGKCGANDPRMCIYVGDLVDDSAASSDGVTGRSSVTIYKIVEPTLDPGSTYEGFSAANLEVTALHFSYADIFHDSQAFFLDPVSLQLFIVTKQSDNTKNRLFQISPDADPTLTHMLSPLLPADSTFTKQPFTRADATKYHVVLGSARRMYFYERGAGMSVIATLSQSTCYVYQEDILCTRTCNFKATTFGHDEFQLIYVDRDGDYDTQVMTLARGNTHAPVGTPSPTAPPTTGAPTTASPTAPPTTGAPIPPTTASPTAPPTTGAPIPPTTASPPPTPTAPPTTGSPVDGRPNPNANENSDRGRPRTILGVAAGFLGTFVLGMALFTSKLRAKGLSNIRTGSYMFSMRTAQNLLQAKSPPGTVFSSSGESSAFAGQNQQGFSVDLSPNMAQWTHATLSNDFAPDANMSSKNRPTSM